MKRLYFVLFVLVLGSGGLIAKDRPLDPNTFVVVGGGLAAGCSNLALTDQSQRAAFPVLMAKQMSTLMALSTFRDGGTVRVISYGSPTPPAPKANQSTLRGLPFPLFTLNPSVPFIRVSESLNLRPSMPIVTDGDAKHSMLNLLIGYPALIFPNVTPWTQIEYAERMFPTFLVVELGSGDVLDAALQGDTSKITTVSAFTTDYQAIVSRLSNTFASMLLLNVPDPTDTAYFSTAQRVAGIYQMNLQDFLSRFGLQGSDLITPGGLVEIGETLSGRRTAPLSASSILRSPSLLQSRMRCAGTTRRLLRSHRPGASRFSIWRHSTRSCAPAACRQVPPRSGEAISRVSIPRMEYFLRRSGRHCSPIVFCSS